VKRRTRSIASVVTSMAEPPPQGGRRISEMVAGVN
jgi:hypothetical protein